MSRLIGGSSIRLCVGRRRALALGHKAGARSPTARRIALDDMGAPALTTGRRLLWRRDAAVSGAVGVRAGARPERKSRPRASPRRIEHGSRSRLPTKGVD